MTINPIIIISLDGSGKKDFEFLSTLPNFKTLVDSASYCSNVKTVYPSLTYPAHTSIVTGKSPNNHGIINNILIQPKRKIADWFWFRKDIKGDTIYDLAKRKGYRTASVLWPVTGKANIDFNIPEIFSNRWWQNQAMVSIYSGSKFFQLLMDRKYGYLRDGKKQPNLDNFSMECMLYLIENRKADFLMLHLIDLDSQKHQHGAFSPQSKEALLRHDERLGRIFSLLKDTGTFENSTIIVLGDHTLLNADYVIKINKLFAEHGLISIDNKGRIQDWTAYMNTCDGSAYIYMKDEEDSSLKNQILNLIQKFSKDHSDCIEEILSSEEAVLLGGDTRCTFMLESKEGFYFVNDIKDEIIEATGKVHYKGSHGYSPGKNEYDTFFVIKGPRVKKNYNIEEMSLLDEGPTIAKILDGTLEGTEGRVLEEIFL
ncbi:alkaline phosphatase family protein [Clostridium polyendosporum]|uniref:Alkaline phosphatase family protein n=1 Tax=Clostridium polyendosporum TaxID=69208 RepID=A0A919S048_9CLOT|nr:ectonucleotide pyrophosphatase/phosphodiesterase [Clostridium polyendosporum]GIM28163.1 alkaline phosphatase family protein [Clostridium polyendosporum]